LGPEISLLVPGSPVIVGLFVIMPTNYSSLATFRHSTEVSDFRSFLKCDHAD